jgi:predicted phage terminase large subunit-like protein
VNEWYNNTLASRLNNKEDGIIILVMQRLHIDDLTGHLLKQDGWELLSLPAIAEKDEVFTLSDDRVVGRKAGSALNPKLEPLEILEEQKKITSDYNFSAQYQQRPIPEKGNILDFELFQRYDDLPRNGCVVQSWDTAVKDGINNDYSACITAKLCNEDYYIMDVHRVKLPVADLDDEIIKLKSRFNAHHVIIEECPGSTQLIQELRKKGVKPIPYPPKFDKKIRANNMSFIMKAGRIFLPRDAKWIEDDFKTEIVSFPKGQHDDQVDALTQLVEVTVNQDLEKRD